MQPELFLARSGAPSIRWGRIPLEDVEDPWQAASDFVSAQQVERAKVVVLFGLGLGYRVRRLRQLGVTPLIFEPCAAIADLVVEHAPEMLEGVPLFSDFSSLRTHLLEQMKTDDAVVLLVPPAYRMAFPEMHDQLVEQLRESHALATLRRNGVVERSGLIVRNTLRNLGHLADLPSATGLGKPLAGTPAFIVSAGPSLDRNVEALAHAAKCGAILAVNTAAPVLAARGIPMDAVVCVEGLRVSDALEAAAPHAASSLFDLSTHPDNLHAGSSRSMAFLAGGPRFAPLASALGLQPLAYGPSVATAALSLAFQMGADPIVLVGQDLAFSEGRMYATGTGREAVRVEIEGDLLRFDYGEMLMARFREGGVKTPSTHRPFVWTEGWGGGRVPATHDLVSFRRWFESVAYHFRQQRRFINATEGGASIQGFAEESLETLLQEMKPRTDDLQRSIREASPLPLAQVEKVIADIHNSALPVRESARRWLQAKSESRRRSLAEEVRQAARRAPMVNAAAEGAITAVLDDPGIQGAAQERKLFEIIAEAASDVLELSAKTKRRAK
mgnify:CR=1 FL=1